MHALKSSSPHALLPVEKTESLLSDSSASCVVASSSTFTETFANLLLPPQMSLGCGDEVPLSRGLLPSSDDCSSEEKLLQLCTVLLR